MSEIWDEIRNEGYKEGYQLGYQIGYQMSYQEGVLIGNTKAIKNIMRNLNLNILEAMKALNIPEVEYEKYKELVFK